MSLRCGDPSSPAPPSSSSLLRAPSFSNVTPSIPLEENSVKLLRWLSSCALVLSSVPSLASADEAPLVERVQRKVEQGLVKPLSQQEGNRFSRARPVPRQR